MSGVALISGNFDGLHLGHLYLLEQLKKVALERDLRPVLLTFEPHTRLVLEGPESVDLLTTLQEKTKLLESLGVSVFAFPFDESTRHYSPEYFIQEVLRKQLNVRYWLVGYDHRFGAGASGGAEILAQFPEIECHTAGVYLDNDVPASSSLARIALRAGDLGEVKRLLGRSYSVLGEVVQGQQLGRTLGFPTANLIPPAEKLLPPFGVYAGYVQVNQKLYQAVANWGPRPTVQGMSHRLEIHLLDFAGDLYGQTIEFSFEHWIRGVCKFEHLDALQAQIQNDIGLAKSFFAEDLA